MSMSNARVSQGFKCFAMQDNHFSMRTIRHIHRFTSLLLWVACVGAFLALSPVNASDALIKGDVEVDVSGKDAVDARTKAMASAESEALRQLLERFTSPQQAQAVIDSLPPSRISGMVRGMEVLSERISDRRYRAHLLVSFEGDEITRLISTNGLDGNQAIDMPTSTAFAIIPIYEEGTRSLLWDDRNPWLTTWKTVGLESNMDGIVVPYGDDTDKGTIKVSNALSATYSSLSNMTNRYGVSQVVILQAKFVATPEMQLTVVKRRLNRVKNEINLLTYRADPEETRDQLLTRAALDIVSKLNDLKAHEIPSNFVGGERNTIMMLASISTMASWTELKAKLTTLPMIEKVDVLAISPQQVDMSVRYRGTPESLETALLTEKLRLVKHANYWVISRD
jgi:hypothetical protein